MQEENRPLNYAGLALAMIVGAIGIVAINLFASRDFVEATLVERARAHFSDALVSSRWLRHELESDRAALLPDGSRGVGSANASHLVRLVGVSPLNRNHVPDSWESSELASFATGKKEAFRHLKKGAQAEFRYMAPVFFDHSCTGCHAKAKVGELAGGIVVSFDTTDTDESYQSNALGTVVALLMIMLGVGQVMVLSIRRVRELGRSADRERERFESLVQTIDGIVWEADPVTLQYTFVSRHAVDLLGYPAEDWLKPGFWVDHLHPEDGDRAIARRVENARKAEPSELEYRFLTSEGGIVWFHDRSSLVLIDGKPNVLHGIIIDITVRKQAEEQAVKLLRAVEQCPVSIIITDRDGNIEYANPRFTQSYGYERAEVIGRNPRILQSGYTPVRTYRDLWNTIQSGKEWRGRLRNRRKDGETIWEDVSIAPVFADNGEITHFLAVKEDVTERLRAEAELALYRDKLEEQVMARTHDLTLAMQKATAADRAKTEFLTNMSHEIRTPLNAIIGFCELALRTGMTEQQRDYLGKIDGAGQHLLQLINNLLDLSKIAAGRVEIATSAFDLTQLLAGIGAVMAHKASEKGVGFRIVVDPALSGSFLGDELRVKQVLLNLINNAIKFTEQGAVSVEVRQLTRDDKFTCVGFAVEDSGIGMDEEELRRAFEPFAQGDASISRRYGGTGLGLSISRDLVGLMGGQLDAQSEKGRGSRFSFVLEFATATPAREPVAGQAASADDIQALRFAELRVLLVEDQPLNRQLAGEMMTSRGVSVEMASNGREAVDCLSARGAEAFDLVLMDIQMPEFDGISAMKAIRAMAGFDRLPIIAMTAHVLEDERRRATAAGANGHLGKPFRSDQLYEILARFAPPEKVQRSDAGPETVATERCSRPQSDGAVLDWQEGLERFGGREDKYLTWLRRFVDERHGTGETVAGLLAEGKVQQAADETHALKGVSGMLALKRVFEAAKTLEASCRAVVSGGQQQVAGQDVDALREALAEAGHVIGALEAAK